MISTSDKWEIMDSGWMDIEVHLTQWDEVTHPPTSKSILGCAMVTNRAATVGWGGISRIVKISSCRQISLKIVDVDINVDVNIPLDYQEPVALDMDIYPPETFIHHPVRAAAGWRSAQLPPSYHPAATQLPPRCRSILLWHYPCLSLSCHHVFSKCAWVGTDHCKQLEKNCPVTMKCS